MFAGFVKSIPVEIEEAAMIDGCTPLQIFFKVVVPIFEANHGFRRDFGSDVGMERLLVANTGIGYHQIQDDSDAHPVFPRKLRPCRDGAMMASIMLTVIPVIVVYIFGQKYIIKGVAAGAVKG